LILSPAAAKSKSTVMLDLSLHSTGARPVALQWTFHYPPSDISAITVDDGPTITSAGKTVLCAGDATAYKCLAVGANAKTIENGVVAKVTATLVPGIKKTGIALCDALGTTADGNELSISALAGAITSKYRQKERSPESGSPRTTGR